MKLEPILKIIQPAILSKRRKSKARWFNKLTIIRRSIMSKVE